MDYKKHSEAILALVLAALVLAAYWRTSSYALIILDDATYITRNQMVVNGMTAASLKAAFTTSYEAYWIPLTWLSYMADVDVSGLDPGGFHRTNVLLFCANAVLLFLFLRSATGSTWKSFFVAALWAMHPLRVESVAWVTERKDMLSGLFFILALWSHILYVRTKKAGWYASLLLCAVLGLLSKPIVVVLPVALLLLDFWPLGRFPERIGGKSSKENLLRLKTIFLEKVPVIALSLASIAFTLYTQIIDAPKMPGRTFQHGLANAATSYWGYLGRSLFPRDLILSYTTFEPVAGTALVFLSFAALLAVSFAAWRYRRQAPYLAFGWFWYLLILIPNSGIIPMGVQNFADRFTYLPQVGLLVALVWGVSSLAEKVEGGEKMAVIPAVVAVIALTIVSFTFTGYWRNTYTLLGHIDEVYGGRNTLALISLGSASMIDNNPEKALSYLSRIPKSDPVPINSKKDRINALYRLGRYDEGLDYLRGELQQHPGSQEILNMIYSFNKAKAEKQKRAATP
jgi:hypothetical protein